MTLVIQNGGWKLEPIDDNTTRATFSMEVDLKGSIPGWIVKQANKDQAYQIVKLRKVVNKYLKDHGRA